jgi:uncharacterized protein YgiM (DUF1202 family)
MKNLHFLLAALAIMATACVPALGTAVVEMTPTALPTLLVTESPTQVAVTLEPAIETPSPTPTTFIAAATATPVPPTPWPEPGLPVLGSVEAPPVSGCVVYQDGRVLDEDLPYVRSGPGTEFGVIGQLGRNRWADGLQVQNGWYEIVVGSGETGWVHESGIGTNGQCSDSSGAEVPVIMNRGAPANTRCVAMRPGSSPEVPPIYLDADTQSTLIARLGNWADVYQIGADWHNISTNQGSGWIEASQADLNMGCGTSGPIRIQFPAGATATTIEGKLPGQAQVEYLFWAAEGQSLDISVTSPENSILFHIAGVSDGQVIKHLLDGESSWQGTLPASQDYLLTLDNAANVASYTIYLSIE